jgi:hypothetical protein
MAALAQEVARSTAELKAAFERGFEEILAARSGDRKEAIFQSAGVDRWCRAGSRSAKMSSSRRRFSRVFARK